MNDRNRRTVQILYLLASIFFYISAVLSFINKNTGHAVVNLGLGSTFMCLSTLYMSKRQDDSENEKDDKENRKDEENEK